MQNIKQSLFSSSVATVISAASSFAQAIIISRFLGLEQFGIIAFIQASVVILSSILNPSSYQPYIIHSKTIDKRILLCTMRSVDMLFGCISIILYILLAAAFSFGTVLDFSLSAYELFCAFILLSPLAILLIIQAAPIGYFRERNEFHSLAKIKIAAAIFTLSMVSICAVFELSILHFICAISIGKSSEFLSLYILMRIKTKPVKINTKEFLAQNPKVKDSLKTSYCSHSIYSIIENADVFLAGYFFGDLASGLIKILRMLVNIVTLPSVPFKSVMLPFIAADISAKNLTSLKNKILKTHYFVTFGGVLMLSAAFMLDGFAMHLFEIFFDETLPKNLLPVFLIGCIILYATAILQSVIASYKLDAALIKSLLILLCAYIGFILAFQQALNIHVFAYAYALFYMLALIIFWAIILRKELLK